MDAKRARDIASSPTMLNVTYDGTPVYIEYVNEGHNTAGVHPLDDPLSSQEVPLDGLVERNSQKEIK